MKKWILKAIVQKAISYLPFGTQINYFFQKYVTKGVYLTDEYFYDRLGHAKDHLNAYAKYGETTIPKTCLELGTGWYPIVPISFFLTGVDKTYSVDITFLTSKERLHTTLQKFQDALDKNVLSDYLTIDPKRLKIFRELCDNIETLPLEKILEKLRIEYLLQDARNLSLEDDSIDLVNSNNTFEHIYPEILQPILKEFGRVVNKNGGVQSHFIDMSDHFAHFDQSITIYNFLQYTDEQWARIDNSIQPQSRLRIDEYKKMYDKINLAITEESFRPGNMKALETVELDSRFAEKPLETVAISHCHFISKM
jgi:SAM-dependent methyltransferase